MCLFVAKRYTQQYLSHMVPFCNDIRTDIRQITLFYVVCHDTVFHQRYEELFPKNPELIPPLGIRVEFHITIHLHTDVCQLNCRRNNKTVRALG